MGGKFCEKWYGRTHYLSARGGRGHLFTKSWSPSPKSSRKKVRPPLDFTKKNKLDPLKSIENEI